MNNYIIYSGKTEKGRRENNEDSYHAKTYEFNNQKIHLLIVADGLGGHAAGDVASKIAVMELRETIKRGAEGNKITKELLKKLLMAGFKKANEEICYQAKIMPEKKNMGTTMVAALVLESGECIIANVGDSRAYLIGDEKIWHTKDHSFVRSLIDAGEITEEEAFSHPMKNIVEKALGVDDLYEKKIDDKILLLSSDGLHDYVRDAEIKDIILRYGLKSCDMLLKKALENEGEDNITVVVAGWDKNK